MPIEDPLANDARRELRENILPFWRQHGVDAVRGGFIGEMSNDLRVRGDAAKGLILNARLLWTFSAAYQQTQWDLDQSLANRARDYLVRFFRDPQEGGYFWELDPLGNVRDDQKKVYGQAFVIYALAEYARVFRDAQARQEAIHVYQLVESHARDAVHDGYFEVLSRSWQPCADMRLSEKDMNEKKSMNNHLHVLEAYAHLLRVWPDPGLARRLREVIHLFLRHILDAERGHFHHFFDETWTPKSDRYTFGHDIEGSWLLCEAAEVLADRDLQTQVRTQAVRIARAVLSEGLDADGGLFYEGCAGRITNPDKEWWPQAEAVVGLLNAWRLTGEEAFRAAAARCWRFIQDRIVDRVHGEWYWRVNREGIPDSSMPKVSAWKCPYHNSRCCLEIVRLTESQPQPNPPNDSRTLCG